VLNLQETIKENTDDLIQGLRRKRKDIHLLTGDNRTCAREIAAALKLSQKNVISEVTPHEKEEYIKSRISKGKKVLMVGDGINDIKAFKEATLSCTINFKSSQNLSFSSFVIIDNDVENILGLFRLSEAAKNFKRLIVFFSIAYNVPVIMAATGIPKIIFGFELPAFMAAWAMFLSSVALTLLSNLIEFVRLKKAGKKVSDHEIGLVTPSKGYARF